MGFVSVSLSHFGERFLCEIAGQLGVVHENVQPLVGVSLVQVHLNKRNRGIKYRYVRKKMESRSRKEQFSIAARDRCPIDSITK